MGVGNGESRRNLIGGCGGGRGGGGGVRDIIRGRRRKRERWEVWG